MSGEKKVKKVKAVPIWLGILIFLLSFNAGIILKLSLKPSWAAKYSIEWSDKLGTLREDLSYGEGKSNKFDLYLPADHSRKTYGLAVYIHAGGFTQGDKSEDRNTLAWLCSKGYVAAGINYTLATEENKASVYTESNEIKEAIPKVIDAAREAGYPIDKMTIAGGSAGHALAMIYAYRDSKDSPVPVVFTYGAVGPSSFHREDWGIFGADKNDEAAINLFSAMRGETITEEELKDGSYLEKMKPIAAADWVSKDSPATVVAYGSKDKIQPFLASLRLKKALEQNGVDHQYFELPHSGHGLQNDNAIQKKYMEAVDKYLAEYMPVD